MSVRRIYFAFHSVDRWRTEKLNLDILAFFYGTASGDEALDPLSTKADRIYFQLRHLRKELSNNPSICKTAAEAARRIGLSTSRFQVLYKQYFGINFGKDVVHFRIKRACSLLLSTDWTVARIAQELEYCDESFFYRQFKQQMDMTPDQYRSTGEVSINS